MRIGIVAAGLISAACASDSVRDDAQLDAGQESDTGPGGGANGEVDPVSFASGTRIKARRSVTTTSAPDGARSSVSAFAGWYDGQRNEPCAPTLAADGKSRCLPVASSITTIYFGDAACAIPVAMAVADCTSEAPAYVSSVVVATCPVTAGPRIFKRGSMYTSYYIKSGATCSGPIAAGTLKVFTAGAEVLPSDFAEMTVTTTTQ